MGAIGGGPTLPMLAFLSTIFWALFIWRLAKAPAPLIPLHILRSRLVLNATLSSSFAVGVIVILTTFLPAYLQQDLGMSVSESGLALAPIVAGSAIGSVIGGQAMLRFQRYRRVGEIGLVVSVLAGASAALVARDAPLWVMETLFIVMTICIGTVLPITMFSLQNAIDRHELGIATSANNFVRQLLSAALVAGLAVIVNRVAGASGGSDFRVVLWATAGALALSYVFLLGMEERPLRTEA